MAREIPGPHDAAELRRFLDTYMYGEQAFLVDELVSIDAETRSIEAVFDTRRALPFAGWQRTGPGHPAHVAAGEIVMITGTLGCLAAWFFHGCRWDEGWTGFGSRIHRADFRHLVRIGPPLRLLSRETHARVGTRRIVVRAEYRFWQDGSLAYAGDQTAMFLKDAELAPPPAR